MSDILRRRLHGRTGGRGLLTEEPIDERRHDDAIHKGSKVRAHGVLWGHARASAYGVHISPRPPIFAARSLPA